MKTQSAIEFLSTYSWAFLILGIFIVSVFAVVLSPTRETQTNLPESCYISPELPCLQSLVLTNSTATKFLVALQNNLGVGISFQANQITVMPSYFQTTSYTGSCYPQNALVGSTIICNASLPGFSTVVGAQLNPKFTLSYNLCTPTCTKQVYNTTGSAVVIASLYKSVVFQVTLATSPPNGKIAVSGVPYGNGANIIFIKGLSYPIYALVPNSMYAFGGWSSTGNITLNGASQSVNANTIGLGTLTATFALTTSTSSSTSTSTSSTSTSSTSTTSTSSSTSSSTTSILSCYGYGPDSCSSCNSEYCTYECDGASAKCAWNGGDGGCDCLAGTLDPTYGVQYSGGCTTDYCPGRCFGPWNRVCAV